MQRSTPLFVILACSFLLTCKKTAPDSDAQDAAAAGAAAGVTKAADVVTVDQTLNPSELYTSLPPMRCDILEKALGGRQHAFGCYQGEKNGESKIQCLPGTHADFWKSVYTRPQRGKWPEVYHFKPQVYVTPLEIKDENSVRKYWVNFRVVPIKKNLRKGYGAGGYLCVPDKSGPQTLTKISMAEGTTFAIEAEAKQRDYDHLVMLTRMVPGVNAAVEINMCQAGEISCWEAAFTTSMVLVDFAVPVGVALQGAARAGTLGVTLSKNLANAAQVGRRLAIVGNVVGGSIRSGQAIYAASEGEGYKAVFLGADAVIRFTTAGILSMESVASQIDNVGSAATEAAAAEAAAAEAAAEAGTGVNPCFGLAGGCDITQAKAAATEKITQLRNFADETYEDAVYEAWRGVSETLANKSGAYQAIDNMIAERAAGVISQGGSIEELFARKLPQMAAESADILADAVKNGNGSVLAKYGYVP